MTFRNTQVTEKFRDALADDYARRAERAREQADIYPRKLKATALEALANYVRGLDLSDPTRHRPERVAQPRRKLQ